MAVRRLGAAPYQAVLTVLCAVLPVFLGAALIQRYLYGRLKRDIRRTLEQIDDTVLNLIEKREAGHFSQTEDSLPGKFQAQINKLYDMLVSYEQREKELRTGLNASISDIAHQINTPITNIKLYARFLQDKELDDARRELFLKSIINQGDKLGWLGESLSKISRLETGIITLHVERRAILPCLLEAIDEISLKAGEHGNDIVLKGEQGLQACFDGKWTREAFYNLLDNAVKYSDENSQIIVEIQDYGMYARVNVANRGTGIPVEERALVFQRFYRGRPAAEREGVGLGLYLVRTILQQEKGYVKIGNNGAGDTVFSVFLWKSAQV